MTSFTHGMTEVHLMTQLPRHITEAEMARGSSFWHRQEVLAQRKFARTVGDEALQAICNRIAIYRVIATCAARAA